MHSLFRSLLILVAVMGCGQAVAADLWIGQAAPQCHGHGEVRLLALPASEMEQEVWRNFSIAKAAMAEAGVVGSRRPAFTWANETRIACGKAAGYLKSDFVDEESVTKCDCFYRRFLSYR